MLVVLRRNLPVSIIETYGSIDGRIAYIKTNFAGCKIAFVALYPPYQFDSAFFNTINNLLVRLEGFSVVIGADMNAVLDPTLDRSVDSTQHSHNRSTSAFQGLMSDFSLTDLYRAINPTSRQYSFYSNRHKSYSRIDYLLASSNAFSKIHYVNILPCPLSDHSIITSKLTLAHTPTRATR